VNDPYEAELARAVQLADLADEITMRHYLARSLSVDTKLDNTRLRRPILRSRMP
jgi:hypothetical protein